MVMGSSTLLAIEMSAIHCNWEKSKELSYSNNLDKFDVRFENSPAVI